MAKVANDSGNTFVVTGAERSLTCLLCERRLDAPPQGNVYNSGLAIEYAGPVMGRPRKANVVHYLCAYPTRALPDAPPSGTPKP